MKNITELRKELKKIGFGIKFQRLSWGRHARFIHRATGYELKGNVFGPDEYALWKPLFEFQEANHDSLKYISDNEDAPDKVYGLIKH